MKKPDNPSLGWSSWACVRTVRKAISHQWQDPPEVIPALLAKWEAGSEVVYAVRRRREGETRTMKFLAAAFYRIFRRLAEVDVPMDAGDFRLVDRRVVDALKNVCELHRFMRGQYVSRIFEEGKRRPLYLVRSDTKAVKGS